MFVQSVTRNESRPVTRSTRRCREDDPDFGHPVVRAVEGRDHRGVGHVRGRGDPVGAVEGVNVGDLAEDVVDVPSNAQRGQDVEVARG